MMEKDNYDLPEKRKHLINRSGDIWAPLLIMALSLAFLVFDTLLNWVLKAISLIALLRLLTLVFRIHDPVRRYFDGKKRYGQR